MTEYGVKGYLTPDSLPTDSQCRILQIPNDVAWLSVFMGALWKLANADNWQPYGDLTPKEAADAAQDVIWDSYDNSRCFLDVPAPFWDNAADVALEASANDQPWYGELIETMGGMGAAEPTLEWHEELRLWLIIGFVAIAGTPAAAIAFAPVARKFVLTFKTGDIGAIARVFIDTVQYAVQDTYSPHRRTCKPGGNYA